MALRTELFLAWSYLRPKRSAVSLITVFSVLGVTLGVAVLMVVVAVMTGFTDIMKQKLIETQAHFQIHGRGGRMLYSPELVIRAVEQTGGRGAAVIQTPVLVQTDGHRLDTRTALFGVSAESLRKELGFDRYLKEGRLSLEKDEVVISSDMARRWQVNVGDRIIIHSPQRLTSLVKFDGNSGLKLNPEASAYLPAEFRIVGIYSVGKYDFDRMVLFAGLEDAAELVGIPWGAAGAVFGWGPDPFDQQKMIDKLKELLPGYEITTWQQDNAQFLGVLATEKNMMFFLLIFIVLVAAFSIANTLITSVYQKTREIGILKALGASDRAVMSIFVLQGLLIGAAGSGCGVLLGFLVVTFRMKIMNAASTLLNVELFPKEFYYFDELPAHIVGSDVAWIVIPSILLCTAGALLPALRAAVLDPAKALRYE